VTFTALRIILLGPILLTGCLLVLQAVGPTPARWTPEVPRTIAILEAHHDDAVIMAGGLAIQNAASGGETHVITLTVPADGAAARVRAAESLRAWSLLRGVPAQSHHLGFQERSWDETTLERARENITRVLDSIQPDIVVIPLHEGGHEDHDVLNTLGRESAANAAPGARVLQAAEYNPFYVARNHPVRTLRLLVRLAPFLPFRDPPTGFDPREQFRLNMSATELTMKRQMLLRYESQRSVIPLSQFGFPDLYDRGMEPPRTVVTVAAKHFSVLDALLLGLVTLSVLACGLVIGTRYRRPGIIFGITGALALTWIGFDCRRCFLEDGVLVALLVLGVVVGAAFSTVRRWAIADALGSP